MIVGAIACIITFAILIMPYIGSMHDLLQGVVTFHTHAGPYLGSNRALSHSKNNISRPFSRRSSR